MKTKLLLILILCVAVVFGVVHFYPHNRSTQNENISVSNPEAGAVVQSPFVVKGQARGAWYFEASFPVELVDANGKVLAQTHATAQGDWMTTDFVPFEAKLEFQTPTTSTGTLILKKDNPSGLPQNDDSIFIPVKF